MWIPDEEQSEETKEPSENNILLRSVKEIKIFCDKLADYFLITNRKILADGKFAQLFLIEFNIRY